MNHQADKRLTVAHFSAVVYSAGRIFNGLSTCRPATEEFLRTGSVEGITTEHDLALLEDLRDLSQFVIDHCQARRGIDTGFVRGMNARIIRSGALHPGKLRRNDQEIGVNTRYGAHMPPAVEETGLERLVSRALQAEALREQALNLFSEVARAQPFEDGNKRTALFLANRLLIQEQEQAHELLTVPMGKVGGNELSDAFSNLLARLYLYDEAAALRAFLREYGFVAMASGGAP